MVRGCWIKELIASLVIAALLIHSFIYEYSVTIIAGNEVMECDIIYSPTPSGNYSLSGACLTPSGRYVKVQNNQTLRNTLLKAVKAGSEGGEATLRVSGEVLKVRYELVGKYAVTLLSELGIGVASAIALLVVVGAAYTFINWRKYVIH